LSCITGCSAALTGAATGSFAALGFALARLAGVAEWFFLELGLAFAPAGFEVVEEAVFVDEGMSGSLLNDRPRLSKRRSTPRGEDKGANYRPPYAEVKVLFVFSLHYQRVFTPPLRSANPSIDR